MVRVHVTDYFDNLFGYDLYLQKINVKIMFQQRVNKIDVYRSFLVSDRFSAHTQWGLGQGNYLLNYYIHFDRVFLKDDDGFKFPFCR